MKQPLTLLLSAMLVLCLCISGYTQSLTQTIYFKTGKSQPAANRIAQLQKLADSLQNLSVTVIEVQGHADNTGRYESNKKLSQKRAIAIKNILVTAGIDENIISIKALGPDHPVASNSTVKGRALNRRAEIIITTITVPVATETPKTIPDIHELYVQLAPAPQRFCINPRKDTTIRCEKGTVIYIKANSLLPDPGCGNTCITFHVKEVFTKSDMILNNLSTTSNGQIIETRGMIFTDAYDCKGNKLELAKGKDIVIALPADSIEPEAKIFKGERGQDSIINWTVDNNAPLSSFTMPELRTCGGWICGKGEKEINCEPCKFFFCRIGRLFKVVKGVFSRNARGNNISFRRCQEELKKINDPTVKIISEGPLTIETRPPLDSSLLPRCQKLEDLFKQYGVNNMEEFILAVNKPLLEKYKVSTMAQLQDTLLKMARENIELFVMDRSVAFNDLKYYIYANQRFGWSNVDIFAKFLNTPLVTVRVDLPPAQNIDCKLVFKDSRIVLPAEKTNNGFQFSNVPQGANAWIVAIKYEDGKPFLAMKEIIIANKNYDAAFRPTTNEELKAQLKFLNQ